jgi:ABC-type glycerol-3-phosphate transport system substrate-binding protein
MMYNTEYTDAAGVKPPQKLAESWTMQQALEAWQKTTKDTNGDGIPEVWGLRWGQGTFWGDYEHGIFRRSNGDKNSNAFKGIADDGVTLTGYLDDPAAIEAMQFYQDLHTKYKVTPIEPIPQIFETKKAAFMVTPDNRIGALNRLYPPDGSKGTFKWGVTGIPYFKTQLCHTGSWHYAVSANSKHVEEAVAFIKFATSDEGARIWYNRVKQLPANVNLYNELSEYKPGGAQALWAEAFPKIGVPRIQTPGYTEYQQVFAEAARDISQGAAVAPRLKQAASTATALLRKYKGWNK